MAEWARACGRMQLAVQQQPAAPGTVHVCQLISSVLHAPLLPPLLDWCSACMQLAGAAAGRAVLRRMTICPSSVARHSRLQRGLRAQASHIPLDHAWLCLCVLIVRYPATSGCRPAGRGCAMSRAGPGAWPAFGSPGCVRGASRTSYLPDQVTSSFRYLIHSWTNPNSNQQLSWTYASQRLVTIREVVVCSNGHV